MGIVAGYVGGEPSIKTTQTGGKVATFQIATTEKGYTTRNGAQIPERTEWHNVVCWGSIAEVAEKYVHKGCALHVIGKIRTRSYDDKSGQTRYISEIECENLQVLDRLPSESSKTNNSVSSNRQAQPRQEECAPF